MATNDTNQPTSLIWVQGNKLQLALPLQIVTFTEEGKTTEDYNPPSGSTISVALVGKFRCFKYTPTISDGNVLHIVDNGELPADSYSIAIMVEEPNGTKRRCKWNYIINVYDSNEKVTDYFDDFPDWGSGAILEGSVFYSTGSGGYEPPVGGIPKSDLASDVQASLGKADSAIQDISGKQDVLVSGTNIKTINNQSILGSGNITIEGGGGGAVDSVNGKTGVVVLDAEDVGAASAEDLQDVADDVATNAEDIATLQAAYAGLTQSDIVPLTSLPASGVANTVYRIAGTNSYTDYMWNGTEFIPMATYTIPADAGVYDISANNSGASYNDLTAALGTNGANVPAASRNGGMSIKYKENVYANYDVVVTEGLTTEPTGTLLESAPAITDGTYKAAQLSAFTTLPSNIGDSLVYYIAVAGDTTTYKQWVITKRTADSTVYRQWRYLGTSTTDADFCLFLNWNGESKKFLTYWDNYYKLVAGTSTTVSYISVSQNLFKSRYEISGKNTNSSSRTAVTNPIAQGETFYMYALVRKDTLATNDISLKNGTSTISSGVTKYVVNIGGGYYLAICKLVASQNYSSGVYFSISYTSGTYWRIYGLRLTKELLWWDESKLGSEERFSSILIDDKSKGYGLASPYGGLYRGLYRDFSLPAFAALYPIKTVVMNGTNNVQVKFNDINVKGGTLLVSFISNYTDYNINNKNTSSLTRFKATDNTNYYPKDYNLQTLAEGMYLISVLWKDIPENTTGDIHFAVDSFKEDRTIINMNIQENKDVIGGVYDDELPTILDEIKENNITIINRTICDYRLYKNIHARVWGASIDAGGRYWDALADKFGWKIDNYAIGGSICLWSNDVSFWTGINQDNSGRIASAWSCTQAEKEAMATAYETATGRTVTITDAERAACYDNSVLGNNDDIDLFIFGGFGGNNESVFDTAYLTDDQYLTDRTTIMGAFGYVINKLMDYTNTANGSKPKAKVLIMGQHHHCNNNRRRCDVSKEKVANVWAVKMLDWWTYLSINNANLSYFSNDGLHPNTPEGYALTAERIVPAIRSIENWLLDK